MAHYQLHCVIYGLKERIDAFLLDQQLIAASEVFTTFRNKMTMHTIETLANLADQVIQPELHLLQWSMHMDQKWKTKFREQWLEFLNHALHFRLEWEIVWLGKEYPDLEWIHTPAAKKLLRLQMPEVRHTQDFGPAIPIQLLK
jgi:hypothetical protein